MADPFSSSISSGPRTQKDAKSNTKTPLDPKNIQDTNAWLIVDTTIIFKKNSTFFSEATKQARNTVQL